MTTEASTAMLARIAENKARLDDLRPLPPELEANLGEWLRVELTYTSNALEGNTLTRQETAMIVRDGLTVEGKTVTETLEAVNHDAALGTLNEWVALSRKDITEERILTLHRHILQSIDDGNAGFYRSVPVRIAGSQTVLPNPLKVPQLMAEFVAWLHSSQENPVSVAADAHFRLVTIHPFVDGNGRTARLLMNLILQQAGFPPAVIPPEIRREYLTSLENGQTTGAMESYYLCVYSAVERSLDMYLEAAATAS